MTIKKRPHAMFSKSRRLLRPFRAQNATLRSANLTLEARPFEHIPSPRALPIVGTTLSLVASGGVTKLHAYVDKRHKQLGHIYKDRIGPVHAVFLSHPEDMRTVFAHEGKHPVHLLPDAWMVYNDTHGCSRGLFFMDGEEWLHFRRIMNRHLLRGDRRWIDDACEAVGDTMLQRLAAEEGAVVKNLEHQLYLWSMEVLVAVLLGSGAYKDSYAKIRMLMQLLADKVHLIFKATSRLSLLPASLAAKWNIPPWRTFVSCVDNGLKTSRSLVDVLLDRCAAGDGLLRRLKEDGVDRRDVERLVTDLVLAAGDTTAYSMEWMLYSLAKNPKVQEEVRRRRGEDREAVLRCAVKETLRLYPVAPFLTRILPRECALGGYRVPAGTLLILSIFTSGRDGRFFSDPEDFRPDRWMRTEPGRGLLKHASLPFAMGARSCVGRRIAEGQLQVTVGKIVDNFRIGACNRRDVDVTLRMVAVPSEPLRLKFERLR